MPRFVEDCRQSSRIYDQRLDWQVYMCKSHDALVPERSDDFIIRRVRIFTSPLDTNIFLVTIAQSKVRETPWCLHWTCREYI